MPELRTLTVRAPSGTGRFAALIKARKVETVTLRVAKITEQDLAAIGDMPAVETLTVDARDLVPPAAWARLAAAKRLTKLDVSGTPMSAEVIAEIGKLAGLEELILGDITLPDAALAPLGALKSLRVLETGQGSTLDGSVFLTWPLRLKMSELLLRSTRSVNDDTLRAIATAFPKLSRLVVEAGAGNVTATGLAHLTKLRHLINLWVRGDAVDDAALAVIVKCDLLTSLEISNARVTEAGVPLLSKLSSLRGLIWFHPPVTDAALKSYAKLSALTTFNIGPKTPPETEQKLKAALPKVKIER